MCRMMKMEIWLLKNNIFPFRTLRNHTDISSCNFAPSLLIILLNPFDSVTLKYIIKERKLMKLIVRVCKVMLISIIIVGAMISCNDDTNHDSQEMFHEPRELDLIFELNNEVDPDSNKTHTYVTEGYTVSITGGIEPQYKIHKNVNLSKPISIVTTGEIKITVSHPDFVTEDLSELAYLGVNSIPLEVEGTNDMVFIHLDMVQAFVLVSAEENLNELITSVEVLGKIIDLDSIYYTGSEMLEVKIVNIDNTMVNEYANILGSGVEYNLSGIDTNVQLNIRDL